MNLTKWLAAGVAMVVLAIPALAAEAIARGKIKSTTPDKNEFVLTHTDGKDNTYKVGDNFIVNRDGKNVKFADIKAGDDASVGYDAGVLNRTAMYVLVHDETRKNLDLGRGKVKAWDKDKSELVITDLNNKEHTFSMPLTSTVQVNTEVKKMDEIKVGEYVWIISEKKGDKNVASMIVAQRK